MSQDGKPDLIVPVYIDTNALLDILASLQDGFFMVEKVTSRTAESGKEERRIGTEFGLPNILSLLKIGISGSKAVGESKESGEEREVERTHTYGSLLYKLRSVLNDKGILLNSKQSNRVWGEAKPSDFVELSGVFRPNPFTDSFRTLDRLLGLTLTFSGVSGGTNKQLGEMKRLREALSGILADVEKEDVRLFLVELGDGSGYKAVVTLFTEYLRDRSMTEILYREFRLLGKVVRNIRSGTDSIDLLRGKGLGAFGSQFLDPIIASFRAAEAQGIKLPSVETRITAPVLEVIPIAIYV